MHSVPTGLRPVVLTYLGFGACAIAATLFFFGVSAQPVLAWLLLPALALLAEFMPVQLWSRGLRVTFTLPYIAGLAVAAGPGAALVTDVAVTVLAAVALLIGKKQPLAAVWIAVNACVAAISCAVAGACMIAVRMVAAADLGEAALLGLVFVVAYGVTNFLLVTYLDHRTSGRSFADNIVSSLGVGSQGLLLYALVGVAVAVLVTAELYTVVALTLLPIYALRSALLIKAELYEQYYETITALTLMLQRAHPYTHGHLERVARTAERAALRLGLPIARARRVREAAVLHDVGKIAIDEEVLDKPGKLSAPEMDHVRQHAAFGADILAPIEAFRELAPWIRHHHERPDGMGYPMRLSDIEIPIESKIIAVADAFDAMTGGDVPGDKRSYREPMTHDEALEELDRCSGTQFDPKVVQAFKEALQGVEA
jgi:putative nucleotidyltransferase with HDIG domain